jgi:hypothetical protein
MSEIRPGQAGCHARRDAARFNIAQIILDRSMVLVKKFTNPARSRENDEQTLFAWVFMSENGTGSDWSEQSRVVARFVSLGPCKALSNHEQLQRPCD